MSPAVADQQAKLGVSAEESKAQRLKRQQARFRDRGGVFVPANSNPLVDILLARTVSGESPSKAPSKNAIAKRLSPRKARQSSPTRRANQVAVTQKGRAVAGSSKKPPASAKGKAKAIEPKANTVGTKPPVKRRGTAKGKKKQPGPGSDAEPPAKPKATSKGKGKQRAVSTTSDGNLQPKVKVKSNPAKKVVEIIVSDDETLVEAPRKAKSSPKRNVRHEDDDETDDDEPIVRKRARPRADDSKAPGARSVKRVKQEGGTSTGKSEKKTFEDDKQPMDEQRPKPTAKKRRVSRDEQEETPSMPLAKKGRAANSTSAKPKVAIEPEPRPIEDVKKSENSKTTGKGKGKGKVQATQGATKHVEVDDDARHPERVSKSKKRKKEDNCDDRPRKVVKISEPPVLQSSSKKLKENQSDNKRTVKPDDPDLPRLELAPKLPSRGKALKGPPREVLERIKASAVRHLRCVDSEPDELDCLS